MRLSRILGQQPDALVLIYQCGQLLAGQQVDHLAWRYSPSILLKHSFREAKLGWNQLKAPASAASPTFIETNLSFTENSKMVKHKSSRFLLARHQRTSISESSAVRITSEEKRYARGPFFSWAKRKKQKSSFISAFSIPSTAAATHS